MPNPAHDRWLRAGEPFTLARPLAALRACLRGHGYTVYDLGDSAHLLRDPPEDHTPYSATGWPLPSPFGWGFAVDIMPPPAARGLPTLAQLGAQLFADRQAGHPAVGWLKYINWEPGDGKCWHDRWQPSYVRTTSTDRGHIHLSGRTDYQLSDVADGYDPVARLKGAAMAELTAAQARALDILTRFTDPRIEALAKGYDKIRFGGDAGDDVWLVKAVKELLARPAVVAGPVDEATIRRIVREEIDKTRLGT